MVEISVLKLAHEFEFPYFLWTLYVLLCMRWSNITLNNQYVLSQVHLTDNELLHYSGFHQKIE